MRSRSAQDYVLGHSQSSPFDKLRAGSAGLVSVGMYTQD
jgi:hypothetical protein